MAGERSANVAALKSDGDSDSGERVRSIAKRLGEVLDERLTRDPEQLSSGASRDTYVFEGSSRGLMVLQSEHAEQADERRPDQAPLLAAAAQAGVPVARVVAHGADDRALGARWIVLEGLAGTADPGRILAGERVPEAAELLESIAAALAAVHRMPVDASLAPSVEDPLGQLRAQHERLGEPHPTFELAFRVLGDEKPATPRSFVHGDFRLGNLLVDVVGVTAVLDWELAHLGDPIEDLGWLCVPAWRFSRPDRPAAGLGSREQLIAAYERHAGVEVELAALRHWELAGTLRWGVICVMQAFKHLSGAIRSVEHAVIGRRACEVEWDLLEMLDPRAPGAPRRSPSSAEESPAPRSALHDRPTALELLDAARGALGEHVLPRLAGRPAFELRVALRALGMVRRELGNLDEHAAVRARALARLGATNEAQLAAAIRDGALDGRQADVCAALRDIVRAKLEVANPRYLEGE